MIDRKIKSVFERLAEREIRFIFYGYKTDYYVAVVVDAPDDGMIGVTYSEAMAYFEEILAFHISESKE